jgi:cold shock CspA family protein
MTTPILSTDLQTLRTAFYRAQQEMNQALDTSVESIFFGTEAERAEADAIYQAAFTRYSMALTALHTVVRASQAAKAALKANAPHFSLTPADYRKRYAGEIKFWNASEGWGYVSVEGQPDASIREAEFLGLAPFVMTKGAHVTFNLGHGKTRAVALNVCVIGHETSEAEYRDHLAAAARLEAQREMNQAAAKSGLADIIARNKAWHEARKPKESKDATR